MRELSVTPAQAGAQASCDCALWLSGSGRPLLSGINPLLLCSTRRLQSETPQHAERAQHQTRFVGVEFLPPPLR
jgi:hypothetical protein